MGLKALMELNDAIYNGLEMKLKVTRNARYVQINILQCKWWWWMNLSLCFLSCVFSSSHGWSWNKSGCHFLLFHSSSKWSWKKSEMVHGGWTTKWFKCDGLERSQFKDIIHCICLRWSWKQPILFVYTMVLKWVNFDANFTILVSNGLERNHLWVLIFSWGLDLGLPLYSVGC